MSRALPPALLLVLASFAVVQAAFPATGSFGALGSPAAGPADSPVRSAVGLKRLASPESSGKRSPGVTRAALKSVGAFALGASRRPVARRPRAPERTAVVRIRPGASVAFRSSPGGSVVGRLGSQTEFGSPQTLSVAKRRGRLIGVPTPTRPNGQLAWIDTREASLRPGRTPYSIHADLSKRRVELRRGDRLVQRLQVTVGAPGSPTPTGRFAVTDKLNGPSYSPYYGCCILALSGTQPNPPPGWSGGNRLAIHGTNAPSSIGTAASAGCLRAGDRGLRALMRLVPLGTPVFIRH